MAGMGPPPKPPSKRRRRTPPRTYGAATPTTAPAAPVGDRALGFDAQGRPLQPEIRTELSARCSSDGPCSAEAGLTQRPHPGRGHLPLPHPHDHQHPVRSGDPWRLRIE
jgi:hypothetical protein